MSEVYFDKKNYEYATMYGNYPNTQDELIDIAKQRKIQYGGGEELATDIVGLEIKGDDQAHKFLSMWRDQDEKNENLYQFIKKNKLDTYGMKVGA